MAKVIVSRVINASANQVWKVIGDFNNVHAFHPFLKSSNQIGELVNAVGAKRQCNIKNNTSQIEEVVEWVEGKSFVVKAPEAPIVGEVLGGMSVEVIDEKSSKVTVDMMYTPKLGILGKLMHVVVFQFVFRLILGRVLKGLKQYVETGKFTEKNDIIKPAKTLV